LAADERPLTPIRKSWLIGDTYDLGGDVLLKIETVAVRTISMEPASL
jgi:hypothetical protein